MPSLPATGSAPTADKAQIALDISRLHHAISGDFRLLPVAYPILARHGFMEYAPNGYKAISGAAVIDRARQLIAKLDNSHE